jgi:hypothetical protein
MSASYQQALLTLQRKRTGGNQQVTVKHMWAGGCEIDFVVSRGRGGQGNEQDQGAAGERWRGDG